DVRLGLGSGCRGEEEDDHSRKPWERTKAGHAVSCSGAMSGVRLFCRRAIRGGSRQEGRSVSGGSATCVERREIALGAQEQGAIAEDGAVASGIRISPAADGAGGAVRTAGIIAVRIPERRDFTGLAGGGWRRNEEQGSGKCE